MAGPAGGGLNPLSLLKASVAARATNAAIRPFFTVLIIRSPRSFHNRIAQQLECGVLHVLFFSPAARPGRADLAALVALADGSPGQIPRRLPGKNGSRSGATEDSGRG